MGAEVGLSPEVPIAERVEMALAEVGYDRKVRVVAEDGAGGQTVRFGGLHRATHWRAIAVAAGTEFTIGICWPCFDADPFSAPCEHAPVDPLTSPWPPPPEVPR